LNPLKQLFGQTAIYGLGTIVPRLLNYLLVPLYTRIFADDQYGIITELYAYVAFLLVLLTYGMETSFFRYAEKEKDPKRVFSTSLFSLLSTSVIFIVVILIFLDPISAMIKYSENQDYILLFAIIVTIDAFAAIPFAWLRQQNRALRFSVIKIINVVVNIGLNLYFLVLCPSVAANNPDSLLLFAYDETIGVGYVFIANLVASVVTLLLLSPQIFSIRPAFDMALLRKMLSYAFPLLIVGLAGMTNEVSDKIIFKYLATVPEGIANGEEYVMGQLGIYGANYKLAVMMTLFIQMFRYAAEPFFFAQAKEENSKEVYAQVMKYFVIFGIAIFLVVTLFIDVFKYFIGPGYWEGLFIVPVVLLANLFLGIFYNLSVWYKLNDITRYGAFIALAGATITIVMNVALVPAFGYAGAAWAHFTCYLSMAVMSYFLGRRFFRIDYPLGRIGLYFVLGLAFFFIFRLADLEHGTLRYLLGIGLMGLFIGVAFILERKELTY
jgi:O-antigen/teichoic acid export membrane protein